MRAARRAGAPLATKCNRGEHDQHDRIGFRILRDDDEAEDVMQDGMSGHIHRFINLSVWSCPPAVSLKQAEAWNRSNRPVRIQSSRPSERRPLLFWSKRSTLPYTYRCVFACREIENMSTSETAKCLDLTDETVKIRLHRARQMLQAKLYALAGPRGPMRNTHRLCRPRGRRPRLLAL